MPDPLLHGQSRHDRWLARAALAALLCGALYGLWLAPVTLQNAIWPLGHHARILTVLAVCIGWVTVVLTTAWGTILGVAFLVRKAQL
jgi:hypothetical protein